MRVVFMGTPEFAVPSLEQLINDGHEVVGVFAQPDKPKGRGYKLAAPPVKEAALAHNIPVYQPEKMRDGEALAILKELNPEVIVVVAYGKILPKDILELPAKGCINVHGSLLPKYRGAGPIQWSVINGEKVTGVTTMYMGEGLDTGDMILKEETEIGENEKPLMMKGIPALNPDGSGKIEVTAGDMAVPCVGIFFKEQKKAFFLFTEQEIKGKNLGFGIEKGRITVQYPSNRGLAYRYVLPPEPNADKGVSVTYGEKIESPLLIRTFDCESITQFFEIFFVSSSYRKY